MSVRHKLTVHGVISPTASFLCIPVGLLVLQDGILHSKIPWFLVDLHGLLVAVHDGLVLDDAGPADVILGMERMEGYPWLVI